MFNHPSVYSDVKDNMKSKMQILSEKKFKASNMDTEYSLREGKCQIKKRKRKTEKCLNIIESFVIKFKYQQTHKKHENIR